MHLDVLQKNLEAAGFTFRSFDTGAQAADYLTAQVRGKTVGMGGSVTLEKLGVYDRLSAANNVYWHWKTPKPETIAGAAAAQVYLTSANAIAETGEIINIDGSGNRVAASLYGKETVYIVVGENKVAPTFDAALWRARNIAAPLNARRLERKTPCALSEELKCFDCKSPERICRGLTVLWRKMMGVEHCEVLLIREPLGY